MSPSDEKSVLATIEPTVVTVIGGTGDGSPLTTGTVGTTPDHQPNLVVTVVTPIVAIAIRFLNSYVTTLIGLVTVGITTNALPAADFGHLVLRCATLSIAGPAVAFAKDLVTILGNLERKYPLATGSI